MSNNPLDKAFSLNFDMEGRLVQLGNIEEPGTQEDGSVSEYGRNRPIGEKQEELLKSMAAIRKAEQPRRKDYSLQIARAKCIARRQTEGVGHQQVRKRESSMSSSKGKRHSFFKMFSEAEDIESVDEMEKKHRYMFYSKTTGLLYGDSIADFQGLGLTLADLIEGVENKQTVEQIQASKHDIRHQLEEEKASKEKGSSEEGEQVFWLEVTDVTEEEMNVLAEIFYIHPLTAEDICSYETAHDKVDNYNGEYIFVTFNSIASGTSGVKEGGVLESAPYFLLLKRGCVLTFRQGASIYTYVENVVERTKPLEWISSDYIGYCLLDEITDDFGPICQMIELEVDTIDELVLLLSHKEHRDMLLRLGAARRKILTLFRLLQGKPTVIKALIKELEKRNEMVLYTPYVGGSPESRGSINSGSDYVATAINQRRELIWSYSDVSDHVLYFLNVCSQCEVVLARTHSNHMSKISLELATNSAGLSRLANNLTVVGVVLLPFIVVSGLFGMNVHVPGQTQGGEGESLVWFFSIIGFCFLVVLTSGFVYFRTTRKIK